MALYIHPTRGAWEVRLAHYDTILDAFYKSLNCDCVDVVRLTDKLDMWVDDNGMINGCQINVPATLLARRLGAGIDILAGPALVCGIDLDTGESRELTGDQLTFVANSLQAIIDELYAKYRDRYEKDWDHSGPGSD